MAPKLSWLLLVSVICVCQNCHGSNDSSGEADRAFGYELLQAQIDYLKSSVNENSKKLTKVEDKTLETSKMAQEKQNALMEQLIKAISNNKISEELTNLGKDVSKITGEKQTKMMEQFVSGISKIADNTNQNKISSELAQVKDTVKMLIEKQSSMMERALSGILMIANNTSHLSKIQKHPIEDCESAERSGLQKLMCINCQTAITVYCEMETFNGGWIVIQQRVDGSENFTRNWQQYRDGFGTVGKSSEYWLGLEQIHRITNSGDYELVVELKDENGKYGYARYSDFKIAGEKEKYRMTHLGKHSGIIEDKLKHHIDMKFTTFDNDNDKDSGNCSLYWHSGGGWWYKNCSESALNGPYNKNEKGFGILWANFSRVVTFSRMMMHRK